MRRIDGAIEGQPYLRAYLNAKKTSVLKVEVLLAGRTPEDDVQVGEIDCRKLFAQLEEDSGVPKSWAALPGYVPPPPRYKFALRQIPLITIHVEEQSGTRPT